MSGDSKGDSVQVESTTDLQKFWRDGLSVVTAPGHFQASDWLRVGVGAGAIGLSMTADEPIRKLSTGEHTGSFDNLLSVGEMYGRFYVAGGIAGGMYIGGRVFHDSWFRDTGRMMFESIVFSGIVSNVLKIAFGRDRPYTEQGAFSFHGFRLDDDSHSFPSGHVTVAFAASSVLAARLDNVYASIGLYGLATLTAVQRVYSDNHWTSDTIFGAAIGTLIGREIVSLNEGDEEDSGDALRWNVSPMFSQNGNGVLFRISF